MAINELTIALAEYRMMFPGATGSGLAGASLTTWQTEWNRVKASGLSAVLITSSTFEGGGGSGQKNFDQAVLLQALLIRRAELDTSFDAIAFDPPKVTHRRRGFAIRFSP